MFTQKLSMSELSQFVNEYNNKSNELLDAQPYKLPTTNRIQTIIENGLATEDEIANCILSTRPIGHATIKPLLENFLAYKREYGSDIEKEFYKDLTVEDFYTRLLRMRPQVFVGFKDSYQLRREHHFESNEDGRKFFDAIATQDEINHPYIRLENYLSYDEMALSALIGVSSFTIFINECGRYSAGVLQDISSHERVGVYTGVVGPRLERKNRMEYRSCIIDAEQNTTQNGYGLLKNETKSKSKSKQSKASSLLSIMAAGYGLDYFPTYSEAEKNPTKFIQFETTQGEVRYINKEAYKARMRLVIEPFLADANQRAKSQGKRAYTQLVGLGLGFWRNIYDENGVCIAQLSDLELSKLQLEVYYEVLNQDRNYEHIDTLNFSYFPSDLKDSEEAKQLETLRFIRKVEFSQRNTATLLSDEDKDKLLVVMYAWDGNAFPGNEYFKGLLTASGDPQAASNSLIAITQNPFLNPLVSGKEMRLYDKGCFVEDSLFSTEKAKKRFEMINEIVKAFQKDENCPELSIPIVSDLENALSSLNHEELTSIQHALEKKAEIFINDNIANMQVLKTRVACVRHAIEKTKTTEVNDVDVIDFVYHERDDYDYFPVTEGDVFCLLPFMSANDKHISSENTCATGESMRRALVQTTHNNVKKPARILKILNCYLNDLLNDFCLWPDCVLEVKKPESLDKFLMSKIKDNNHPILQGKIKRYLQLKQYLVILEKIVNNQTNQNQLVSGLPDLIKNVIGDSNAVSFVIVPQQKGPDGVLRLDCARLFSLDRNGQANRLSLALVNSLSQLSSTVFQKLTSTISSQETLLLGIKQRYAQLSNQPLSQHVPTGTRFAPQVAAVLMVRDSDDVKHFRNAVVEVLKTLDIDVSTIISKVNQPYRYLDATRKEIEVEDKALCGLIRKSLCIEDDDNVTFEDGIIYIFNEDDRNLVLEILKAEQASRQKIKSSQSPFDQPEVKTWQHYHELIQIFLVSACFAYEEYRLHNDIKAERMNFGQLIEAKDKMGLVDAITCAINEKTSLEDAMLAWLEKFILLKSFTEEMKIRIKTLFKAQYETYYNPLNPAPHIDEFMMVMKNSRHSSPKVVIYRGDMTVPLDFVCSHPKSNLNKLYGSDLPRASSLKLTKDYITLPPTSSMIAECKPTPLSVMNHLLALIEHHPVRAATLLTAKTKQGKRINTLLSEDQINTIKKQPNWPVVLKEVVTYLHKEAPSQEEPFKKRFTLNPCMPITRECEYALYADFDKRHKSDALNKKTRTQKIIHILHAFHFEGAFQVTQTAGSTHFLQMEDYSQFKKMKERILGIYEASKTRLFVAPNMAASLYRRLNVVGDASQLEDKDARFTPSFHVELLKSDSKFPVALKALYPHLTIVVKGEPMPEGKTEKSSDVIVVSFNSLNIRYGYEITSSNPDHLNQIRQDYELSIIRVVTHLEAGKLLQAALTAGMKSVKPPILLNKKTFGEALDALSIIYYSIEEINGAYQITCDFEEWQKLKKEKENIELDSTMVDCGETRIAQETIDAFFDAIKDANIEEAKQLLGDYPGLINAKDKKYQSTPLISVLTMAKQNILQSKPKSAQALLSLFSYLIEQPGLELAHTDKDGNTVLHKSVYFALNFESEKNKKCFVDISAAIWEKARKEGTQPYFLTKENVRKELVFVGNPDETRLHYRFIVNTVKSLLAETHYWDFHHALAYLDNNETFAFMGDDKQEKPEVIARIVNELKHPESGKSLLQLAIEHGDQYAVDALIARGANVNAVTKGDEGILHSPLGLAFMLNEKNNNASFRIIEKLIASGANFNASIAHYNAQLAELKKANHEANHTIREQIQEKEVLVNLLSKADSQDGKILLQEWQEQSRLPKENEHLKAEYGDLREQNKKLTEAIESSKKNIEVLERDKQDAGILEKELEEAVELQTALQLKVSVVKEESSKLQSEYDNAQSTLLKNQDGLKTTNEENETISKQLDEANQSQRVLKEQLDSTKKIMEALEKDKKHAEADKAEMEEQSSVAKEELENAQALQNKLSLEVSTVKNELSQLQSEYENAQSALVKNQDEFKLVNEKNERMSKELDEAKQGHSDLTRKIQSKRTKTEGDRERAEKEMKQAKKQLEKAAVLQSKLMLEVNAAKEETSQLQSAYDNAQLALLTKQSNLKTANEENKKIDTQLEMAQEGSRVLEQRLQSQKNKNAQKKIELDKMQLESQKIELLRSSQAFFARLEQLPEYKALTADERLAKIESRIDKDSYFQDESKNQGKLTALKELKVLVEKNREATLDDLDGCLKKNKIWITQSTCPDYACFRGDVTSAPLFDAVEKFLNRERKLQQETGLVSSPSDKTEVSSFIQVI